MERIPRRSVYDKSSKPSGDDTKPASVGEDSMGPDILYDEFEKAFSELKNGKATGIAGILSTRACRQA